MIFLPQRQQVAIKIETTEGTDASPAAADVIAPVYDLEWVPAFEGFERNVQQDSFSRIAQVIGERSAVVRFATEFKGSGTAGTAPAHLTVALQACGFSETIVGGTSVTYAPASENIPSVTIVVVEVGDDGTAKLKKIVGARGTVAFDNVKGQPSLVRFEFTGRYIEPTEGVAFTTPSIGVFPEPFLGASLSFQGVSTLKVQNVMLDMANSIQLRNDVNQASGNFSAAYTGRVPTASLDPEQEKIAVINFLNNLTIHTQSVLSFVLGATAGNIMTLNAPKVQIVGLTEGDRNGIRIVTLDCRLNQSVAAGDDELTIVFT